MPRTPDPGSMHASDQPGSWASKLGIGRSGGFHAGPPSPILARRFQPCTRAGKEGVPPLIVHLASQDAARKSFALEVLHRYQAVTLHPPVADLVMKRSALVADLAVCLGHDCGSLAAATRALTAGKPALRAAQVRESALQVPGLIARVPRGTQASRLQAPAIF